MTKKHGKGTWTRPCCTGKQTWGLVEDMGGYGEMTGDMVTGNTGVARHRGGSGGG